MKTEPLKLLSAATVERLANDIEKNLDRYLSGSFADIAQESGWAIETSIARWDPSVASKLDPSGSPDAEVRNSMLVYSGLRGMTPALAREERLWARLSHVECLDYARGRWISDNGRHADNLKSVKLHFFAPGFPGCRDDNAIGRLWWNGHIAALGSPDDIELGLKRLLARANIRKQVIERADTAFRQPLISGIVRLLGVDGWFETYDAAIADFMVEVNKRSGGLIFEALTEDEVYDHLVTCAAFAKERRSQPAEAA